MEVGGIHCGKDQRVRRTEGLGVLTCRGSEKSMSVGCGFPLSVRDVYADRDDVPDLASARNLVFEDEDVQSSRRE